MGNRSAAERNHGPAGLRQQDRGARADRAAAGVLTLAGVPIGRPEDAPARLAGELGSADVIAAEDTRRVRRLAATLGVQLTGR